MLSSSKNADRLPVVSELAGQLGQALRQRRKVLGISATAAAQAARVSRVTWHRLEKGELTVALGSLLGAANVLGMVVQLQSVDAAAVGPADGSSDAGLPLRIRLGDYPQLQSLAWQVGNGEQVLSPREALGMYERNWRHLQPELLESRERALIDALRQVFEVEELRV